MSKNNNDKNNSSYLGNNINMTLVIIIVLVVTATLGTAIFFNKGLTKRTSDFENTYDNLTTCNVQLNNYKQELDNKESELNSTTADIRKYDQLYEQKVSQLNDKESQLAQLTSEKNNAILLKEEFKTKYEAEKTTNSDLQIEIKKLEDDVTYWKNKYQNLKEDYDVCGC